MTCKPILAATLLALVLPGCGQAPGHAPAPSTAAANPYPADGDSPQFWSTAEWNRHAAAGAKAAGQPGK
jgi:hypothetical protein